MQPSSRCRTQFSPDDEIPCERTWAVRVHQREHRRAKEHAPGEYLGAARFTTHSISPCDALRIEPWCAASRSALPTQIPCARTLQMRRARFASLFEIVLKGERSAGPAFHPLSSSWPSERVLVCPTELPN